jgi:hypothetical protein
LTALIGYRSSLVTPDTAEALRSLERAAHDLSGVRIHYGGTSAAQSTWAGVEKDPGPTGLPARLSFRPTGREVYLRIEVLDKTRPEANPMGALSILWSLAVPLGFVPWSRYPVPGPHEEVFHYLGPWASLGDFLSGEGRGDEAWPSMCAAAQHDVGRWDGPKYAEYGVQTHLHRLGVHCGPVDGMIGERTLSAIRAIGMGGLPLSEVLDALGEFEPRAPRKSEERRVAHFSTDGPLPEAFTSGQVHTVKTRTGYAVAADGPGRLILLFGEQK